MPPAGKPVDASVEPTREVLRRVWLGNGRAALRPEGPWLACAERLANAGWLMAGEPYPCYGTLYHPFEASFRLDVAALRDI